VADVGQRLAAARAGSREALGEALEACRAYLLVVAERELDPALRAKGGASDLVQQTFLEAQRDFGRFHGSSAEQLRAWLRQILRNNVASFARQFRDTQKRQAGREVALPQSTPSGPGGLATDTPTPSRHAIADEDAAALQAALERLPDDYRQVIALRYDEDRPFGEIAQIMQRSPNAVRKLWARAVEQLQREMGKDHDSK
jgi:RNA polymerase sigma-70 factor (ECF subfamily)